MHPRFFVSMLPAANIHGQGGMSLSGSNKILQSTVLLTAANFIMRSVSMAFHVYLSDSVGAAGIGLLQLILTVNGFAVTLGTSGIRVSAMYLSAEEYGLRRPHGVRQAMLWCLGIGAALSSFVGFLLLCCANPVAQHWVKDLRAAASLRLLGLTLPITCINAILSGYYTACGKIRRLVLIEMLDQFTAFGLTVFFLQRGAAGDLSHACLSIIGGNAVSSAASAALLFAMMLLDFRKIPPCQEALRMGTRLRQFCIPVALNDYLRSGLGTIEQFLIPAGLSRRGGSRTSALAEYGVIQGMVFPVILFPTTLLFAVNDLLVPRLARSRAEQNLQRTQYLTEKALRGGILYAGAAAGLLYSLSEHLGILLYDSSSAVRYLRLFAPLVPVLYLDCITDGIHKGLGQQIYCVRVNTLTNLLDVVFLYLLVPRFGIGGYFFTYTLTHILNFYLSIRRLLVLTDLRPAFRFPVTVGICAILSAAIICVFLPSGIEWSTLLVRGGLYLTLYTLLLLLSGSIDKWTELS